MAIKTNSKYNFDKAENDVFSWNYWDGTSGSILTHKATGREIYQMQWCTKGKCVEPVTGEIKDQAIAFWAELRNLREHPDALYTGAEVARIEELDAQMSEPKHGENGYCRKCHSYCYGDCEAN